MSTSVLPQLLEVDSELSAQAIALEAQLSELQEKRKGIQTVISMFELGETSADADASAVTATPTTTKTATKKTAVGAKITGKRKADKSTETKPAKSKATRGRPSKVKTAAKAVAEAKTKAAPEAEKKVIEPKETASTKAATNKTEASKRSGRTADWQRYLQGTYKKSPLPDVIVGVLQAQPDTIFKIADVMNVVFKEDMPKSHFLKARNRISNILSAGARDGVWHRGRGGTYSMSKKAVKAS